MKMQSSIPERLTFSVTEAAMVCGLSERTVRQLISRGTFPGVVRVQRRVLIVRSQLEQWLASGAVAV